MGKVIADVSPSVDGYAAGEGITVDRPFGDAGYRLHRWIGLDSGTPTDADREVAAQTFATAGAVVLGRRMFDVGIAQWGDDGAFGLPCFVVTHRERESLRRGPTTFTFVTDGVDSAVRQARAAAGAADVVIAGSADVVQQCLALGLVDEIRLHVVPVLLGHGTRLFERPVAELVELRQTGVVTTPLAIHLTFQVTPR